MSDGHTWMTTFWHEELDSVGNLRFCHFTPPQSRSKSSQGVFPYYSQIQSVSLASHVATRFLIHLSAHLCHHHHSHHPSLLHSFTPGSKPIPLQQILPTFDPGLSSRSRDRTGLIMLLDLFLVRFSLIFLLVSCGGLSWLHVSFLLHVKYTIWYRMTYAASNLLLRTRILWRGR